MFDLSSLAKEIEKNNDLLSQKAKEIREKNSSFVKKIIKISENKPSGTHSDKKFSVCAVDGGLFTHRLHGIDIVAGRAIAVNFSYCGKQLTKFDYFPTKYPEISADVRSALDEHEALVFRSLVRLKQEISCAIGALVEFSPDFLFLDGSLLPLPSDRPSDESALLPLYFELLDLYKQLFSKTKEKNCILCGVIKDSRSRRISKQFSVNCSDTVLCSYLLEAEEMTIEMDYENSGDSNNLHKQKNTLSKDVKFFYIKPSNDDLPLRIEYLASEEQMVDRLAFTVYSLCSISPSFAYPAVLIEADMRAALDQKEILAIQNSLFSIDRKPLRRNSRPFR